ncbi:MAG: hypothetical protein ACT4PM_05155 [Gemmatimonadales bacterium]
MSGDGDLAALTVQLARDPSSLVFLPLGEALRRRGELEAALPIAEHGVAWYPEMTGAWDLLARVRSDRGEGDLAFDAWTTVLRLDPEHAGAHKGLAFLAYRAGELERSLRHLRKALELTPGDAAVQQVFERVRREVSRHALTPAPVSPLSATGVAGSALLTDLRGRRLDGQVAGDGDAAVGAALAHLSRDAERTARVLRLGPWRRISLMGSTVVLEVRSPTIDSLFVLARPAGQECTGEAADRLARAAAQWLEGLR